MLELPPGAVCLARNTHDPHHAFRFGACAWGVQFHPEYTVQVMKAYIRAEVVHGSCGTQELLDLVRETPEARRILRDFAALCLVHG